jgi:predicted transcriptional regulator
MQAHAELEHGSEAAASVREDADAAADRERFVAAVEQGLADVRAGRVIDDDELGRWLDAKFGPLE